MVGGGRKTGLGIREVLSGGGGKEDGVRDKGSFEWGGGRKTVGGGDGHLRKSKTKRERGSTTCKESDLRDTIPPKTPQHP